MGKKKKNKKKEEKITSKAKEREKAKKVKAKAKEKAKKEKTKSKKDGKKEKNAEVAAKPKKNKGEKGTTGKVVSKAETPDSSSLSVNTGIAVLKIRSLSSTEEINSYIAGDVRVTVKKAATSRIASLSGK